MTSNRTTVQDRTGNAAKILERSVCLSLQRHWFGNNRKVDVDDLVEKSGGTFTLDDRMFSATKALIDSKELKPVRSVQNQARAYLYSVALPSHKVFGDGTYLVPLGLVEQVNDRLNDLRAELKREAAKLAARFSDAVEKQRIALGPLFKISDYCQPEQVIEAYDIDWTFVSFAAPEKLETVSHALAEAAHKKHEQRLATAFDEVVLGLRSTALDIVSDLLDKLTPDETGRQRVLRGDPLGALCSFAELLPQRNLTDDAKLPAAIKALVARAQGISTDDLRSNDALRDKLRKDAEAAKKTLAGLVKEGPRRAIKLPGAAA
jgi:hypothetical protein